MNFIIPPFIPIQGLSSDKFHHNLQIIIRTIIRRKCNEDIGRNPQELLRSKSREKIPIDKFQKKMFHGIMIKLKWNTVLIYIEVSYNLGGSLLGGHFFLW